MQEDCRTAFEASTLFKGIIPQYAYHRFTDRESISAYAEENDSIGLITRGIADIWSTASDGTLTLINTIRKGDAFGVAYLYSDAPMQTSVIARGLCEAAFIRKNLVQRLLENDREFARRYFTLCNAKLQFLLGRIGLLTAQSCRTKLAAYFLLNSSRDGTVTAPAAKEELANRLSVSRAAVYRELSFLQKSRVISSNRAGYTILNRNALEKLLYESSQNEL